MFPPIQVQLFLLGRPRGNLQGLARAVVKDSNDGDTATFIDSDGAVSDTTRRCVCGGGEEGAIVWGLRAPGGESSSVGGETGARRGRRTSRWGPIAH